MAGIQYKRTRARALSIPPFSTMSLLMSNNDTRTVTKKRVRKESPTVNDKMLNIYLEQVEKNNTRFGPFVRCDYVEELVERENLNYLVLEIYPSKLFFYIKNPDMQQYFLNMDKNEDEEMLDQIENEEIPSSFLALFDKYDGKLMYDFHIIIQIQAFPINEEGYAPLFNTFVLLKPTDKVQTHYMLKAPSTKMKNLDRKTLELQNEHESTVLFEMCPSLYLEKDKAALYITYLYGIYRICSYNKPKCKSIPYGEPKAKDFLDYLLSSYPDEPCAPMFCYFGGTHVPYTLEEQLNSILVSRKINIDNLELNHPNLVEAFCFEVQEEGNSNEFKKFQIHVYMKHGSFHASKIDNGISTDLFCVGIRIQLDMSCGCGRLFFPCNNCP